MCLVSISCSAQRMFSDVSSIKGVTSIYVGKTMLQLAGNMPIINTGNASVDISDFIKDLTSIEIVQCENSNVAAQVKKICKKVLSKYHFEIITEATTDDMTMTISGVFEKKDKYLSMLFLSVNTNDSPTYILMKGKIDIENLNKSFINK